MDHNSNTTTQKEKSYIVIVAVEGRPYIHSVVPDDDEEEMELIQEIVGGYFEQTPHGYYTIHPVFAQENKKWDIVRQLLTSKLVTVYGNEDGMRQCSPNMALVTMPKFRFPGQPHHSWGNEVLIVPERVLKTLKISPDDLKEECAHCEKELGETYTEVDTLSRLCVECANEEDEEED